MKKQYFKIGSMLEEIQTESATEAMRWHRSGDDIDVMLIHDNGNRQHLAYIPGATQLHDDRDENRDYCKRVADELESYVAGDVFRCPECGEIVTVCDDIGDKFCCPHCRAVSDWEDWEQLGIYDYMSDVLDYDFRIDSQREFTGIRVWVTLGGPSCWIDTERRTVEIRWGNESACYGLLSDTVDAVEEWGRKLWEMGV